MSRLTECVPKSAWLQLSDGRAACRCLEPLLDTLSVSCCGKAAEGARLGCSKLPDARRPG